MESLKEVLTAKFLTLEFLAEEFLDSRIPGNRIPECSTPYSKTLGSGIVPVYFQAVECRAVEHATYSW